MAKSTRRRGLVPHTLRTTHGEQLRTDTVWREYPRPQLQRDSYFCLNGQWEYAFSKDSIFPARYDGTILVPFSPEAPLSGVARQLQPDESLFYRCTFTLPEGFVQGRVHLHFGAVDQMAEVYVNDTLAGSHTGGFLPFSLDITALLQKNNTVILRVRDYSDKADAYHSRGKQSLLRGNIWYTAQSGIWQTVWLESTPEHYIKQLHIIPDFDQKNVSISLAQSGEQQPWIVELLDQGTIVQTAETAEGSVCIHMEKWKYWSPESPFLYDIVIRCGEDTVHSYMGMRKTSIAMGQDGYPRLMLNNEPYFHNGLLDQGYWPDGLLTPPSDEAMLEELRQVKALGFNMLRKHIKIEPDRWYYHCDQLGILVWQDFVNGGERGRSPLRNLFSKWQPTTPDNQHYKILGRQNPAGQKEFVHEAEETVHLLSNHPCIVVWVPFNEGWGQFDSKRIAQLVKQWDRTRPVDHASGWYDQGAGDFNSRHDYSPQPGFPSDHRAKALTEFGGLAYVAPEHSFQKNVFGYQKLQSQETLNQAYRSLYETSIIPEIANGLCACVYTQLTDVEDELNGLFTYDRKVLKLHADMLREINARCASVLKECTQENTEKSMSKC